MRSIPAFPSDEIEASVGEDAAQSMIESIDPRRRSLAIFLKREQWYHDAIVPIRPDPPSSQLPVIEAGADDAITAVVSRQKPFVLFTAFRYFVRCRPK